MLGDFMERLQKIIAEAGYASRRKAEELISLGKVKVNGNIVREMGYKVDFNDYIEVEGHPIQTKEDKVYYLLNKPRGVVATSSDEKVMEQVCCEQDWITLLTSWESIL